MPVMLFIRTHQHTGHSHPVLSPANCASRIRHLSVGESAATGEARDLHAICPNDFAFADATGNSVHLLPEQNAGLRARKTRSTARAKPIPVHAENPTDPAEGGKGRSLMPAFDGLPVFQRNTAVFRRLFLCPAFALPRSGQIAAKMVVSACGLGHGQASREERM